ncbi:ECF transporter S component [Tessaracoccus rhinocerotis]|uniref:ECF transporter S component n=1 Tax=Tessaracoccus rhinocerotis TaxID=1689449 RepID=A0A553K2V1_9ACTN|nr:ECF transporter S component [Tessaracoccus rhinocerotis]TRY19033.1 ECF transporter S component [Tessaracoccus rhinocerotis]
MPSTEHTDRTSPLVDVAAPVVGVQLGWRSWSIIIVSSVIGLFTIAWPLLMPAVDVAPQHADDAPYVFAFLLPVVLMLVIAQISDGGLDAKALALLGVLSAINAAIRPVLGAGTAGVESIFFLLVLAGRAFGPGFGYLLGFTSMFASALLTAGVGPWLPSQMLCAAWVGLGAGLLPRKLGGRAELLVLIGYGIVAAYLFGALMNLWFWPFISGISIDGYPGGSGSLDYVPGAPPGDNLVRFGWFTLVTSTAGWDTGRAITTTVALLLLGRPVLGVLRRASGMARVIADPC